ncbi:MAG: phosphatidylglycerophosphatase A [Gammaproteobacteria bacterium]
MSEESNFPNYKNPFDYVSTLFGVGLIRFAPGTWGTLFSIFLWLVFFEKLSSNTIAVLLAVILAIVCCHFSSKDLNNKDQKAIVIDELAGMWVALLICSPLIESNYNKDDVYGYVNVFIVFLAFRFFDILKPFPISYFDKNLKNGFGIVFDDLIAGIFAGIFTILLYNLF